MVYAFQNRDYTLLLNIQKKQIEFDTMTNQLQDFINNVDVSKITTDVNAEYKTALAEAILLSKGIEIPETQNI